MTVLKIATITATAVIALASAWSTQLSHGMFHAFPSPPPPPPPPPLPFRSFFQDTTPLLLPRGYYHLQHPPPFPQSLQPYRPHASSPPPPLPPPPPQPAVRLIALQPLQSSTLPPAPRQVHTTDNVHHVHVFYYYYLPAELAGETFRTGRRDGGNDQGLRKPCDDPPAPTTGCPPPYLPPPSPSLPPPAPIATPPPPPPPSPPSSQPQLPPTEAPCDDTVVVDNAEYYPFGRSAPIVVAADYKTGDARDVKGYGPPDNGNLADRRPSDRRPEHKSNFILANYLLPPDNK